MARLRSAIAVSSLALSVQLAWISAAFCQEPKAQILGEMPAELRQSIVNAVGESQNPPASRLEARRRAQEAGEDAIAVLESSGYWGHRVEPDVTDDTPSRPVVTITPGPRFDIAVPLVTWLDPPPPEDIRAQGEAVMGLDEGQPGSNGEIVGAQGRIVASVQQNGYADARAEDPVVIVDHDSTSIIPEFRIRAGALVLLNGVDLRTEGRTNPAWVRQLAPWEEGDAYDPEDVAELERRLLDAGVYQSVTVALAPLDAVIDGKRPVLVSLADRPRATLELGAGYSTNEGPGIDGRLLRFNRFGRADTLTFLFRFARIQSKLDVELSLPHWRRPDRTLKIGAGAYNNITDAYDERGVNLRGDITQHYAKTSYRTYGVALDFGQVDELAPVVRTRDIGTVTGLAAISWDNSDDPLNPTRGWRLDARGEPTLSAGGGSALYLRAQAQGSYYLPLGERAKTVIAARLKLGTIAGASLSDIPSSRRFYAGGGGSVRGYEFQGVGPRIPASVPIIGNTPEGGLGLFESSLEVRHSFTDRWGGVVFADFGGLSSASAPDFSNTSAGIGFGVRYDLGFGPIRADVAVPLSRRSGDPAFQVYLSIGQSF